MIRKTLCAILLINGMVTTICYAKKSILINNYLKDALDVQVKLQNETDILQAHIKARHKATSEKKLLRFNGDVEWMTIVVGPKKDSKIYLEKDTNIAHQINDGLEKSNKGIYLYIDSDKNGNIKYEIKKKIL